MKMRITVFHIILLMFLMKWVPAQSPVINEVMASNDTTIEDSEGDNPDWIELFNPTSETISLKNWSLSDDKRNLKKWQFNDEALIQPYGFTLIFASGKEHLTSRGHCAFRLDAGNEPVFLAAPTGKIGDSVTARCMPTDISYGRESDGGKNFSYFKNPSPGYTNNHSESIDIPIITDTIHFSHNLGFYKDSLELKITHADTSLPLHYTLNGTMPAENDALYEKPIPLKNRTTDENDESAFQTAKKWDDPDGKVLKGTVVRAASFKNGCKKSFAKTGTFFIGSSFKEISSTLPVISLAGDEDSLFEPESGIYVKNPPPGSKPVSFGYYKKGAKQVYHAETRIAILTDEAEKKSQKSLLLKFSADTSFHYPFFKNSGMESYRNLHILSPQAKNDLSIYDEHLLAEISAPLKTATPPAKPVVVFFNGEYWGIHHITTPIDKPFLKNYAGNTSSSLTLIKEQQELLGQLEDILTNLQYASEYPSIKEHLNDSSFIRMFLGSKLFSEKQWGTPVLWKIPGKGWRLAAERIHIPEEKNRRLWNKLNDIHKELSRFREYREKYSALAIKFYSRRNPSRIHDIADSVHRKYASLIPEHIRRWHYPSNFMEWESAAGQSRKTLLRNTQKLLSDIANPAWNPINLNPNPANRKITINSSLPGKIKVFDSKGRCVYEGMLPEEQKTINISNWQRGIYLIRLTGKEMQFSKKLVVGP
ncbi:MAG: lamin tail domain-containing protein [Bacteroidales bacterium]|nr:lamin tail domain-containing protein [Bacteroidales bacterium]